MSKTDGRVIRASDLCFAAALLAGAALCALLLWFQPQPAERTVVFRRDGEIVARRDLSSDGTIEIAGAYSNVFRIENGSVRVVETNCPNHACQAAGAVSQSGAAIICAPNHVSVTVEGSGGLDAFTG